MNTKNALHRIITELDSNLPDGITKDNLFDAIDVIKDSLVRGKKFEEMWADFKSVYGYRTTFDASGENQLSKLVNIMDKAEVAFLGSTPRTRKERFNDIIAGIYDLDVTPRADKVDIVNSLIELRNEEERV